MAPPSVQRKYAYPVPKIFESAETTANTLSLLRILIILCIAGAAVSSRLFAVVRFESIIHEFDPWFNFRATRVLVQEGVYEFWNWFDPSAWYPLGRVVGGTVYPGIMLTSYFIHQTLHLLSLPVNIRDVCVLLAPAFSGLTAYSTYLFGKEVASEGAGLWAALFIGIVPGYISRSVAGSYDNEAIAIFILMTTFYLWVYALKRGSALYGAATALFYFYMVAAWGGYAFITNMLPLHALVLILMGRFNSRLYVAYSSFYAIGTLASMQVPFVGFQPIRTSEHMAALGVFGLLQLVAFAELVRSHSTKGQFKTLLQWGVGGFAVLAFAALVGLTMKGYVAPWTGRFYSLWDTGYAKIHIPIIASVSEHQPTAWPSFFMDLNLLIYLFPCGVWICFRELKDEHVFLIIYSVLASYFAGVMVRLILVLTPVVCITAAVAVSKLYETYLDPLEPAEEVAEAEEETPVNGTASASTSGGKKKKAASVPVTATPSKKSASKSAIPSFGVRGIDTRLLTLFAFTWFFAIFVTHCTYVTSSSYSSPSVVLASTNPDGSQHIIDDFREAYYWLRMNTEKEAKVMSWWDYGYQIAGFADRYTLVDNNTWNNTHIATVGKAMSSREEVSYPILRKHDVDYVLVIFGGLLGFSGDDINKFLWMIRIAEGIWPDEVKEANFFTPRGEYKVDDEATPTMRNSLMYKMSYYRFNELFGGQQPVDRVRGQRLPQASPTLDTLEEAFTSENWIVRIYQVKKDDDLSRPLKNANSFNNGIRKKRKATKQKM